MDMKVLLKIHSTLLLITSLAISGNALATGDPLVKKTKSYSKSYTVGANDKVSFDNRFGELKINTWDKNEVKVDVTMSAEANTDEKAQQILDVISIEDGKKDGGVYFKTNLDDKKNKNKEKNWEKGEKQGFNIDYVVYIPARSKLDAHNEFGATTIGDFAGEATLVSKFGSLTTGKLTNVKEVSVEFGKATIGGISDGDLTIKFSKATVDNIDGNINARFEYCDGVKINVSNAVKKLSIDNSFTQLFLDLNNNLSATFDISTSFSELNNKSSFTIKQDKEDDDNGPHFDHQYNGKSGSGSLPVKIKSSFGEVTLGHNLPDNVINEKKAKKKKTTSI
jgi:hypothetical protein